MYRSSSKHSFCGLKLEGSWLMQFLDYISHSLLLRVRDWNSGTFFYPLYNSVITADSCMDSPALNGSFCTLVVVDLQLIRSLCNALDCLISMLISSLLRVYLPETMGNSIWITDMELVVSSKILFQIDEQPIEDIPCGTEEAINITPAFPNRLVGRRTAYMT
jgi:hypothetical protein